MSEVINEPRKSKRGFASMDPEMRRSIASKGGKSVPPARRSFSVNPKLAADAGRKGGSSLDPAQRSFFRDPLLAAEAGRKGGKALSRTRRDESKNAAADDGSRAPS